VPRVIDDSVDPAITLLRLMDEPLDCGRISEVARYGKCVQLSGKATDFRAACEEGEVISSLCEEAGAGCADALARRRDDGYWCRGHR
jgi:hypothetical protein